MTAPVAVAPGSLVAGPGRSALPYGLFSTFTFRPATGDRWEAGVAWERQICDPVDAIGAAFCDPADIVGLPKNLARNGQGSGEASPFTVYGHFNCSPVGFTVTEAQRRAEEHLTSREEQRVEFAFWTGDLGNTPSLQTDVVTLGAAAVSLAEGLGALETWIGYQYGSLGVIHLTRGAALAAAGEGLLETKGGRLLTKLGTPVAAGAGYPGTAPGVVPDIADPPPLDTSWGYVSTAIFGYRSEIFNSSSNAGDLFDRRTNDLYAIAERNYLLGYDDCGTAAIQLDLSL